MYILGISCYYHDSAAAVLKDGQVVAAVEEERFSREKNDDSFPRQAIDYCMKEAGISGGDLDCVAGPLRHGVREERQLHAQL